MTIELDGLFYEDFLRPKERGATSTIPAHTIMSIIIISMDHNSVETNRDNGDSLAAFLDRPHSSDDDRIDPAEFQELLATLPSDAIEIRQSTHHPDWEHGDPCPECGNESLSVMSLDEDIYASVDGEFEFIQKGDALGPPLSILCPECMTHLAHIPYQHLAV